MTRPGDLGHRAITRRFVCSKCTCRGDSSDGTVSTCLCERRGEQENVHTFLFTYVHFHVNINPLFHQRAVRSPLTSHRVPRRCEALSFPKLVGVQVTFLGAVSPNAGSSFFWCGIQRQINTCGDSVRVCKRGRAMPMGSIFLTQLFALKQSWHKQGLML